MKKLKKLLCGLFIGHDFDPAIKSTAFTSGWLVIDIYKCKKCGKYKVKKESR